MPDLGLNSTQEALFRTVLTAMEVTSSGDQAHDANMALGKLITLLNTNRPANDQIQFNNGTYDKNLGQILQQEIEKIEQSADFKKMKNVWGDDALRFFGEGEVKKGIAEKFPNAPQAIKNDPGLLIELVGQGDEIITALNSAVDNGAFAAPTTAPQTVQVQPQENNAGVTLDPQGQGSYTYQNLASDYAQLEKQGDIASYLWTLGYPPLAQDRVELPEDFAAVERQYIETLLGHAQTLVENSPTAYRIHHRLPALSDYPEESAYPQTNMRGQNITHDQAVKIWRSNAVSYLDVVNKNESTLWDPAYGSLAENNGTDLGVLYTDQVFPGIRQLLEFDKNRAAVEQGFAAVSPAKSQILMQACFLPEGGSGAYTFVNEQDFNDWSADSQNFANESAQLQAWQQSLSQMTPGTAGYQEFAQEVAQKQAELESMHLILEQEEGRYAQISQIEAYKSALGYGDPNSEQLYEFGRLPADFATRNAQYINDRIAQTQTNLQQVKSELPQFLQTKIDALKVPVNGNDWSAQADAYVVEATTIARQIDLNLVKSEAGQQALVNLGAKTVEEPPEGFVPLIPDLLRVKATNDLLLSPAEIAAQIEYVDNISKVNEQNMDVNGVANNTDVAADVVVSEADVKLQNAALAVETALHGMAPFLKEQGLELDLPKAPDTTFDEKYQQAFQTFLLAADYKKFADMGENKWLYTEAKGEKLAAGIKANEELIFNMIANSEQMKTADGKPKIKVDADGKLAYAVDDPDGAFKANDKLNEETVAKLKEMAESEVDSLFENINILNNSTNPANALYPVDNKGSKKQLVEDTLLQQQLGDYGFLVNFLVAIAKMFPGVIPFVAEAVSWFTGGKVNLYDIIDDAAQSSSDQGLLGLQTAVHSGSQAESAIQRLKENFQMALESKKADGTNITIDDLKQITEGALKGLEGYSLDPDAYQKTLDDVMGEAKTIIEQDPDDPDYDAVSDVIVTKLTQRDLEIRAQHQSNNNSPDVTVESGEVQETKEDKVTGYSPEEAMDVIYTREKVITDDVQAIIDNRRDEEEMQWQAKAAPIFHDAGGRIMMRYYDQATKFDEEKQYNKVEQARKIMDTREKQIEALGGSNGLIVKLERQISELTNTSEISDLERQRDKYQAELDLAIFEYKGERAAFMKEQQTHLDMLKQSLYKTIDVTADVQKLAGYSGPIDEDKFPGLAQIKIQRWHGRYQGMTDDGIRARILNSVGVSYNADALKAKAEFNEVARKESDEFEQKWERLERKEDRGVDVSDKKRDLIEKYDPEHNKYLERQVRRGEFEINGVSITSGDDGNMSSPSLKNEPVIQELKN